MSAALPFLILRICGSSFLKFRDFLGSDLELFENFSGILEKKKLFL